MKRHDAPQQEKATSVSPLNIRINSDQRYLIESAAEALDKSLSEFVRDTMLRVSEEIILERRVFSLGKKEWEQFALLLDAPAKNNPRLKDLLSRKPLWD